MAFGGGGGGSQRPIIQQTPAPAETDPQVQNKRASRITQARYSKGFMSTMSDQNRNLGAGTIATSGAGGGQNPVGSTQQLG